MKNVTSVTTRVEKNADGFLVFPDWGNSYYAFMVHMDDGRDVTVTDSLSWFLDMRDSPVVYGDWH